MNGFTVVANIVNHKCLPVLWVNPDDPELSINDRNRELGMYRLTCFFGTQRSPSAAERMVRSNWIHV